MVDKYGANPQKPQPKHKTHTVRFHLTVGEADKQRLIEQAKSFLGKRDQVKVTVQLRGRERSRPQYAIEFLNEIVEQLKDYGSPANAPKPDNLQVTLNPKKV